MLCLLLGSAALQIHSVPAAESQFGSGSSLSLPDAFPLPELWSVAEIVPR